VPPASHRIRRPTPPHLHRPHAAGAAGRGSRARQPGLRRQILREVELRSVLIGFTLLDWSGDPNPGLGSPISSTTSPFLCCSVLFREPYPEVPVSFDRSSRNKLCPFSSLPDQCFCVVEVVISYQFVSWIFGERRLVHEE
jgi:hypothetical protein